MRQGSIYLREYPSQLSVWKLKLNAVHLTLRGNPGEGPSFMLLCPADGNVLQSVGQGVTVNATDSTLRNNTAERMFPHMVTFPFLLRKAFPKAFMAA